MRRGRHVVRLAGSPGDLHAAQRLRWLCFRGGSDAEGGAEGGIDVDGHDALCRHVLVEDSEGGTLVGCFRLLSLESGAEIGSSYSARFYDLGRLRAWPLRMAEVGRFCVRPGHSDPDILRAAWAALTAIVDAEGIGMLFGCSSFRGTDPAPHAAVFARLRADHLAPERWRPGIGATQVVRFGEARPQAGAPQAGMPPLLRSYMAMGGWVSDHAVVDADLGTLHVFTGLEIAAIPPARQRLLRALAAAG